MRSGRNASGSGSSTCKGPGAGTPWWLLGSEWKPAGLEQREKEGERDKRMLGGRGLITGPLRAEARTLGFVLRAGRKLLHGLKQGNIVISLTF